MSKFQWKNNLERKLNIFEIISQKLVNEEFYLHQIVKNLLPEKRKENM